MNNYTPFVALWLAAVSLSSKSSIVQAVTFESCVAVPGDVGPTQTVYENLCGTSIPALNIFGIFCGIIDADGFKTIKDLLKRSTGSRITVFAPIDGAFTLPLPTSVNELQQIIGLHIVADPLTLDDLICDGVRSTIDFSDKGVQQQKTKCITGGQPFQIGGGNKGKENWPQIGTSIAQVFDKFFFSDFTNPIAIDPITPFNFDANSVELSTGSNVVSCNGIIQVLDKLLRPAEDSGSKSGSKSGKSDKGGKGSKSSFDDFHRELETDNDNDSDNKRSSDSLQRRKRRLEALLEPNGNIVQLN